MLGASDRQLDSTQELRPDFASLRRSSKDNRSPERLFAHYSIERELSNRLRFAPREERLQLYTTVYKELFDSLPDHPQRRPSKDPSRVDAQLCAIVRYLDSGSAFLEIGCGGAALAFAASKIAATAYGLDVIDDLIDVCTMPANFVFVQTSGIDIPLPDNTIDFAYSYQFIEHLHPNDAVDQLSEIHRVLKYGGRYMCITPPRVTGPHDISVYFDYEATCLHLREYEYGTLRAISEKAGFREFSCLVLAKGRQISFPYWVFRAAELAMFTLPVQLRARLAQSRIVQAAMGINAVMTK